MTTKPLIITGTALVCLVSILYAQTAQKPATTQRTSASVPPKKTNTKSNEAVRIKTFYLKDSSVVMGRIISEDRNQITVEQFSQAPVVIATYAKRQIVPGTIHTKIVSKLDYYLKFALVLQRDRGR